MNRIVTTLKEKLLYAFGNMGSYILWVFTASYITVYATDCLQLSSNGWAYGVLGTIILVCRFFDGLSDIGMGILIDRTSTKYGKARPWYGLSLIPLSIVFFLMFFLKGSSEQTSLLWIGILYFLFTVILYTMNNISFNAMLPRISNDSYDQTKISTMNSVFTSVGSLVAAMAIPILSMLGGSDQQFSWTVLVGILAVFALLSQIVCFVGVKEKKTIVSAEKSSMDRSAIHRGMKALMKTKYFYIAILMFLINYYLSLSVSSVGKYYAQWLLGNANYSSLMGSLPMITMGVGLLATPFLAKKFGKRKTMMIAVGFVFAGNVIGACVPTSLAVALTGGMVKGFGSATVMCELFTLAPDLVRYVEGKSGVRVEGLAASANSFGCKIGSGIGSAAVIWSISLCHYDAAASSVSALTANVFTALYWWIPAVLSLVLLLLASRWDIEEKMEKEEEKEHAEG
jgi:GPH family glycoside/pentoside/hexuronide:cation symporter